ncbi:alpha/beta hydrolase [Gudongella sp. DL1XJH-153]|uniref:alpha/beta hydrolase n=1 Tax=Gudongella sp. DL1XJH-153 TaxID=3409804 RepID=UPI003BB6B7D1
MEFIKMRDGYEIYFRDEPAQNPKGVITITHGFAEHCSRYDHVSNYLIREGYSIIRYDLRGHGRNKKRGRLNRFEDYVDDLAEIVQMVSEKYPHLPQITLGHSMGGLITALYGIEHPNLVTAQILSGPTVGKLPSAEKLQPGMMKFLSGIAGGWKLKNPVDEGLCGKEGVYEDYINDPLVLHKVSLELYYQFLFRASEMILEGAKEYNYPCLIIHGKIDPIVPVEISRSFYNTISSQKKDLIEYDGLYHEILNEDKKDEILDGIINWIKNL